MFGWSVRRRAAVAPPGGVYPSPGADTVYPSLGDGPPPVLIARVIGLPGSSIQPCHSYSYNQRKQTMAINGGFYFNNGRLDALTEGQFNYTFYETLNKEDRDNYSKGYNAGLDEKGKYQSKAFTFGQFIQSPSGWLCLFTAGLILALWVYGA